MKVNHIRFDAALTLISALGAAACSGNVSLGENEKESQTEQGSGGAESGAGGSTDHQVEADAGQGVAGSVSSGGATSGAGGATGTGLSALCTGTSATEPLFTVPAALSPGDERYECVRKTAAEWFILDPLFVTSHPGVMDVQLSVGAPTGPDGSFSCGEASVGEHLLFSVSGAGPSLVQRPGYLFEAGDQLLFRVHTVNVTDQTIDGTASLDRPCSPGASGGIEFALEPGEEQDFCMRGSATPPHSLNQVGAWAPAGTSEVVISRIGPNEQDGGALCRDGDEILLRGEGPGLHSADVPAALRGLPPGYELMFRVHALNVTATQTRSNSFWWER